MTWHGLGVDQDRENHWIMMVREDIQRDVRPAFLAQMLKRCCLADLARTGQQKYRKLFGCLQRTVL